MQIRPSKFGGSFNLGGEKDVCIRKKNGIEIKDTGNKNFVGKVENDKMIISVKQQVNVKDIDEEYILGKMMYKGELGIKDEDIRYSFDYDTHNFHIVPSKKGFELGVKIKDVYKDIQKKLPKEIRLLGNGQGNKEFTSNHFFKYCRPDNEEYEYLIMFSRLWVQDNKINNNFLQTQFVRYRWKEGGKELSKKGRQNINWQDDKFDMMYPLSGEDGSFCYNTKSGHCVYNPYDLTIESDSEKIAKQFIAFMRGEIIVFSKDNPNSIC